MLQDGTGSGNLQQVNGKNEAVVFSVMETESINASEAGLSYNINTGDISSISSGDSTLIYFKNDEEEDIVLEAFAVGLRGFTSLTDMAVVTMIRNPTGGDLLSDTTAVAMNQNRNFGSSDTLSSTSVAYKGKNSGTVTGGTDIAQFYMGNNSRLFAGINFVLQRGSSVAIKVVGDGASAGTAYCALIIYKHNPARA